MVMEIHRNMNIKLYSVQNMPKEVMWSTNYNKNLQVKGEKR